MSIDRWMDKEVVIYIHNWILLSHKNECIWVSSNEVNEPRTYYTEWRKSERESQIPYSNAYIQNLEKWYWRIYLQKGHGGTRDQIANICWIIEKAKEFQKNIYFCFIDYAKAFDCVDHNKLENSKRDGNTRPPDLPLEESVCRLGSNS